ncbi:GGDEF domain-containing protein [Pseudoalteromonas sp. S16_S37]|uniref:GGDEF domain-containing protein n=1 Tax=Pseudoalteromonas sp. S16_S37 TaxID=2720228 RepID=UPI001EED3EB9|nr:GGDEF domain-containing protein [Pseudoalteromonas sp. S16_S37]
MSKVSSCGYEWTIQLVSQNSEHTLDKCLSNILSTALAKPCPFAFYFSKSLSIQQTPCVIFTSSEQWFDEQLDVPALVTRLNKLNHDVQLLSLAQMQILPVRYQGLILGFLAVDNNAIIPTSEHNVLNHILNIYVHQLATLQYARIDPLTQLLNRQTFDEKVIDIVAGKEAWLVREHGNDVKWYMAMADIDHFKHVNDNHGHVIGDEVILLVAQLLKSNFRIGDYVFRYGGEEFAIVFPCKNEGEAIEKLDNVRAIIAATRFPQVGHVTISLGVVELKDIAQVADFVNRADQALYQSKLDGRNRVTAFSSLDSGKDSHRTGDIELF